MGRGLGEQQPLDQGKHQHPTQTCREHPALPVKQPWVHPGAGEHGLCAHPPPEAALPRALQPFPGLGGKAAGYVLVFTGRPEGQERQ